MAKSEKTVRTVFGSEELSFNLYIAPFRLVGPWFQIRGIGGVGIYQNVRQGHWLAGEVGGPEVSQG